MIARQVTDALKRRYPCPEPNPVSGVTTITVTDNQEWVSQCLDSLGAEGQDTSYENVEAAYLDSDLAQTTLQGAIPQELNDGVLFPRPTLVQLHSITEIGASAFALNTAREQRREVLSGATRIRGIDDDEDDIDDSKLPAYPRSMLGFEVSDGRSTIRAFEYRRLPELQLGETRLGLKVSSVTPTGQLTTASPTQRQGPARQAAPRAEELHRHRRMRRRARGRSATGFRRGPREASTVSYRRTCLS